MKLLARSVILITLTAVPVSAAATGPRDLPRSYLFTASGRMTPLHAGVVYRADLFPLTIRVTPAEPGWSGAQWRSGSDYFRGGGPPHYGWIHLGRGSPTGIPQGLISIMTAYAPTPSVAATVNVLRTRGRGASYGARTPVAFGAYVGVQFDGEIVGARNSDHAGHYFVPFSPRSHSARYYPDEYPVYGDVFRVIVLGVQGKTIVIYIENVALPGGQFPAFLARADAILKTVRFPR